MQLWSEIQQSWIIRFSLYLPLLHKHPENWIFLLLSIILNIYSTISQDKYIYTSNMEIYKKANIFKTLQWRPIIPNTRISLVSVFLIRYASIFAQIIGTDINYIILILIYILYFPCNLQNSLKISKSRHSYTYV